MSSRLKVELEGPILPKPAVALAFDARKLPVRAVINVKGIEYTKRGWPGREAHWYEPRPDGWIVDLNVLDDGMSDLLDHCLELRIALSNANDQIHDAEAHPSLRELQQAADDAFAQTERREFEEQRAAEGKSHTIPS